MHGSTWAAVSLVFFAAACSAGDKPASFRVEDVSRTADSMYEMCKPERYLDSIEDYEAYRAASRKITSEEWSLLDHYPCKRKVTVERGGVTDVLFVNLSGSGILKINGKTEYFECAEACRKRAGWEHAEFR